MSTVENEPYLANGDTIASFFPTEQPMSAVRAVPLLVCSIGNPGNLYANTLHSAGHTIVQKLADKLDASQFSKSREYGNGLVTQAHAQDGEEWTLWQSTAYMNDSGKGVKAAHREWSRRLDGEGKLVVIHDELEKSFGSVTLKTNPSASTKGHNGLKSIKSLIGDIPYARIGIGIGRPISRDSNDVANYVLRKMTSSEKEQMDRCCDDVIAKLKQVSKS